MSHKHAKPTIPMPISHAMYLHRLDDSSCLLPGVPLQAGSVDRGELIPGTEGAVLIGRSAVEHLHQIPIKVLYNTYFLSSQPWERGGQASRLRLALGEKGSLNTNFNSERNSADISARRSSLLVETSAEVGVKADVSRTFLSYARANWEAPSSSLDLFQGPRFKF